MAIDKESKFKITEEWQSAFPELTLYSQGKLYKVNGCIVIGIELVKLPRTEEYRPHFVIYPLWKNGIKECLDIPIILKEFYNKKKLQYDIPYEKHSLYFQEIMEAVKSQAPLSFAGDISLRKILSELDEYSKNSTLSAAPDSYLQAVLYESKLHIALYFGIAEAKIILDEINKKNWDKNHFEMCGVDINKWLQSLEEKVTNRDAFLKQVAVNKQDNRLKKLVTSEITI